MKSLMSLLKTTALGGLFFLLPLVAVVILFNKAFEIMKLAAVPLAELIPIEGIGGIALVNIFASLGILLVCILGGLAAKLDFAKRFVSSIEAKLLLVLPKYTMMKAQMAGTIGGDAVSAKFNPVLVRFDDYWQVAFEFEQEAGENRTIYLPGSPDPWSGSVVHVLESRIYPLDMGLHSAVKMLQKIGRGSVGVIEAIKRDE